MNCTRRLISSDHASFIPDDGNPISSSGVKRLYPGRFMSRPGMEQRGLLIEFMPNCEKAYGTEVATLSKCETLGVGPRLLAPYFAPVSSECAMALIIEHAGTSLEAALFHNSDIAGHKKEWTRALSPIGSPERERENSKILFDIAFQLHLLHSEGIYHRDLRAANICLRFFGPNPQDIRATIVDFDLSTSAPLDNISFDNRYYTTLFKTYPERMAGHVNIYAPSPLDIDIGYLSALAKEMDLGAYISGCDLVDFQTTNCDYPLFFYQPDGRHYSRRVNYQLDLVELAKRAGLHHIGDEPGNDALWQEYASKSVKRGGFYDAGDRIRFGESVEHNLSERVYELTKFTHAKYAEYVERQGLAHQVADINHLPNSLRKSSVAKALNAAELFAACGYRVSGLHECPNERRIRKLPEKQVEYLAYLEHERWIEERLAGGWVYGPVKDIEKRISPWLIPYSELPDEIKEIDRRAVKDLIDALESIGLAIGR